MSARDRHAFRMGPTFTLSWRYLAGHPELVAARAHPAFPAGTRRALLGSLVYLPAILLAFPSPLAALAVAAAVAVYFAASKSDVPGLISRIPPPHDIGPDA